MSKIVLEKRIAQTILTIVDSTRKAKDLALGVSTRAALQLMNLAKAYALIRGRTYVTPDDIKVLGPLCFAHRIIPSQYSGDVAGRFAWQRQKIQSLVDAIRFWED